MKALKITLAILALAIAGAAGWLYSIVTARIDVAEPAELYITASDDAQSVGDKLEALGANPVAYRLLTRRMSYSVKTGHYVVKPADRLLDIVRRLQRHDQQPVRMVVPSVRLPQQLCARLAQQLMADSAALACALADTALLDSLGWNLATLPAMIIPNTYQVYWDITPRQLVERLNRENAAFWNAGRQAKADSMGLTRTQVSTLASIVAEETANNAEKPVVAGLYYNRVKRGMKLEADPTVKFALGDFTLRRILFKHLEVESPYNTYRVEGLPPGPIRIPDIVDIDAVLDHRHHDYIYMCAKEDFSGTHNFARTLAEHLANARRYSAALNKRGIK